MIRTLSIVLGALVLFFVAAFPVATQVDPCTGARDLRLTNGKIVTMDARGSTVNEVTIQDGRFAAVGPRSGQRLSPCTREINLRGRTVVPGLIDNHNHIVLLGIRPGVPHAAGVGDVDR
jgi:predicted amidohydrolase YtcJ